MFLDPKFFDKDDKLHASIRASLLKIANDVLEGLKDKAPFTPAFIVLTGSLTGLNWDEYSDIDLHIGVDFSEFPKEEVTLYKSLLAYYSQTFNTKGYSLKGRKVEIYFQDTSEKHEAPGIYDLVHGLWIKIPDQTPHVLNSKVEKAADEYLNQVEILTFEWDSTPRTREEIENFREKVNTFFKQIVEMRKLSLLHDGMYGLGNLVFKELRRNRTLEKLSTLRSESQEAWYEVGESMSIAGNIIRMLRLLEQIDSLGDYFDQWQANFSPSDWTRIYSLMNRNLGVPFVWLVGTEPDKSVSSNIQTTLIRKGDPGASVGQDTFYHYFVGAYKGKPFVIGGIGDSGTKPPMNLFVRKADQTFWMEEFMGQLK